MSWSSFAAALAGTRIGATFNQYAGNPELEARLVDYLERASCAQLLLVGEAAGYRGARVSGLAFTSERQLTGAGPAEASATIVHRVLGELGLEDHVLLWNVVPTHPHRPGEPRRTAVREPARSTRRAVPRDARGRRAGRSGRPRCRGRARRRPGSGTLARRRAEFRAGLAARV
jgi:hypothetical protein